MKLQPCPGFVIVVFADICCGTGLASNQAIGEGDLIRGETLKFEAREEVQPMVIHTGQITYRHTRESGQLEVSDR